MIVWFLQLFILEPIHTPEPVGVVSIPADEVDGIWVPADHTGAIVATPPAPSVRAF